MKSMMSRSSFMRSPRERQDSNFSSHSHSQSTSLPNIRQPVPPSRSRPEEPRRGSSMSVDLRGMQRLEQRRNMEQNHYMSCKAREHNYNPPVDLRLLDYTSTYDNNLMCPICRCPFVDPVVLTECDHCFCRDCIRQTWNTNTAYSPLGPRGDCPSCRTPAKLGPRSATSKILVNLVDELVVKCPKADDGCKAEIKRGEVQDHVSIYCGYALVECVAPDCDQPVRRKDATQGCLHFGVSCMSCHKELQKWRLETHWRSECRDRKVHCDMCKSAVFYRELEDHNKEDCPAISIACPGKAFGCTNRSKRGQAEVHAKTCMFAKLSPMLTKQQERLDEQEAAQKLMTRKMEAMENGFEAMRSILYPTPSPTLKDERLSVSSNQQMPTLSRTTSTTSPTHFEFPAPFTTSDQTSPVETITVHLDGSSPSPPLPNRAPPVPPGPRPDDLPEPFTTDFDLPTAAFPPPSTTGGPYASPLHHLLSMHESLRDELARISTTISELDGRHSMQILNENLRTREDLSYLGAQLGGLQRQVHWLTSTQLQRQQTGGGARDSMASDASAGAGVEAAVSAVSTAATALRGAARVVNVGGNGGREGQGHGMRRGTSEEGRTKL